MLAARIMKFMGTPITTTDVLLNPENTSLASSTPVTNRTPMALRKTRSERCFVKSRIVNYVSTVTMVIHAWRLKPKKTKESASISITLATYKSKDTHARRISQGAKSIVTDF